MPMLVKYTKHSGSITEKD